MEENIQQIEEQKSEVIKIEYEQPKLYHKILGKFIDALILAFVTIILFIASRAIVQSTPMYRNNDKTYKNIEIESALFINANAVAGQEYKYGDNVQVITSYLPKQDNLTYRDIVKKCDTAIKKFFTYLDGINHEQAIKASGEYDTRRLALTGDVLGYEHYFINRSEYDTENLKYYEFDPLDEIIIPLNNSEIPYYSFQSYFDNFYHKFIDDILIDNYLVKNVPLLTQCIANEGKYILFIEIPTAYITACILVFFIPTLCFRRGRKTLGRALYRIGFVDSKCFSPSFGRNLARFAILLLSELILSLVTFGLPFIISFTMMVVTKKHQNFPDYLLGLTEIDTSKMKIYYNKIEALSDKATIYKKAPDFKLP